MDIFILVTANEEGHTFEYKMSNKQHIFTDLFLHRIIISTTKTLNIQTSTNFSSSVSLEHRNNDPIS